MKRILILSACLLFLAGSQFAFAGSGGNGQTGNNPDDSRPHDGIDIDIFEVFQSIMTQIMDGAQAYSGSDTGAMPKVTDSTGCVYVDVYLPDSVSAPLPFDSTMTAGSLLIKNCDSQAAQIELEFAFTISVNNFIDTTLTIENLFIHLDAGDSAYCEFIFPVPPFNATYTLCVTAISGGAVMTDCATMVVTGQDIPDIPYHAPGFLFQGPDCVLFMEMGDSNAALILENYGEFGPGDSVYVVGTLVDDCGIECTGAFGCVIDNTIDSLPGPPPPPPFSACGFLVQGQNCVLFSPEGFGDTAFVLDEYGSFQVGDTVFVSGDLEVGCETDCIDAMGCIRDNIIDVCSISPPPPPPPFEACGILLQGENCVLFTPMGYGDTAFVLDEYGSFQAGDTVFVFGDLEIGCETDCVGAMGCIYNNMIESCQTPPPPPFPFAGCGLLVQGTNCVLFSPGFAIDTLYTLANYGAFQAGDTVFVIGDLFHQPDSICVDAWGHIDNEVIELCQDTVPDVFAGCGYLYEDQGCVIFQPENQTEGYLLYNYQDFGPGDTVYVEGEIVDCQTDCDVFACIDNPIIQPCSPPPPPVFDGCGIILDTPECTLFKPFTWINAYFVLSDYGGFVDGDSVFVSGTIAELPDTLDCPGDVGYIAVDSIVPCDYDPDNQYSGIGYLGYEGTCLVYYDLFEYYTSYVLENYGDFVAGDTVFVEGTVGGCDFNCSDTALCLLDNTIVLANLPPDSTPVNMGMKKITEVRSYPNPFNPVTKISFNIPVQSRVTLDIYNILGQKVETLIEGEILQGKQEEIWNGDRFASGIYFYRIKTDYDVVTKKMILNK